MDLILSIETAISVCSVAIYNGTTLLYTSETHIDKSHAQKITMMIREACVMSGIELSQLKAVAISKGPGSYTGLRIGASTAKGLCYALDIPLIAVDTLQAIASHLPVPGFLICPMIDARRLEVYCALYDHTLTRISDYEAKVVDNTSFLNELNGNKILFCGNGAEKCKAIIEHPNAFFIDGINPTAKMIGFLAYQKYMQHQFENLVTFEPFYLKEFYMPGKKG